MPAQYVALWNTAGGGSGFSTFHSTNVVSNAEAQNFAAAVRALFNALVTLFPNEVTIDFDTEVTVMDLSGNLTAVYAVTKPAIVVGSDTSAYNRAAGCRIDWNTNGIVSGRRLTGRTFLVPTGSLAFDGVGLLTSATVSAIGAAAATFITSMGSAGGLCVWSKTHTTSLGVVSASVPAKGAILRGRRD